jgi:hypothetical protein
MVTAPRYIPEDSKIHTCHHENLKSHIIADIYFPHYLFFITMGESKLSHKCLLWVSLVMECSHFSILHLNIQCIKPTPVSNYSLCKNGRNIVINIIYHKVIQNKPPNAVVEWLTLLLPFWGGGGPRFNSQPRYWQSLGLS